jgi:hypothetical protein
MKLSQKIAVCLSIAAVAAVLVYLCRNNDTKRMLSQIADEGYETAQDILFPGKEIQSPYLRYGPVIPE